MHNVLYVMSTSIKICCSGRHELSRVLLFILNSSSEPRVVQVFIQFIFRVKNGILSLPGWNPGPWGWVSNVLSLRCTCSPTCQDIGYLWSTREASVQHISQVLRLFSWPKVCRKLSHVCTLKQKKKNGITKPSPKWPLIFFFEREDPLWWGEHIREGQVHGISRPSYLCSAAYGMVIIPTSRRELCKRTERNTDLAVPSSACGKRAELSCGSICI